MNAPCGGAAAAAAALQQRSRIAGFYDHYALLAGELVVEFTLDGAPRSVFAGARHVAVALRQGWLIDAADRLLHWPLGGSGTAIAFDAVAHAAAGDSGQLAIRCDGSLWQRTAAASAGWRRIADAARHAAVGDSSDHYIDGEGRLHAGGLAHRGQYGDGKLAAVGGFVAVAERARAVVAHTGHAVYLRDDGAVLGTGGNRYGPLSRHGLGDKADRWGVIFDGAVRIATGSRHTLALRGDGSLWGWGGADGVEPKLLLRDVAAIAAGNHGSAALGSDGTAWRWRVGEPPARMRWPAS